MKRSGIKRRTPLKRSGSLGRTSRINPVNRERKRKQYARNFGERATVIRSMPCLVADHCDVTNCAGDPVAAHATARGMGGAKGDRRDLVPLCWWHHEEAGERRTSKRHAFELRYGFSVDEAAVRIAQLLDDQGYE